MLSKLSRRAAPRRSKRSISSSPPACSRPCCASATSNGARLADGLGNRLRELREAKGFTQAQLADLIGVSRKTVNTVENGVFVPSTVVALKLAAALECRVEELFFLAE